MKSLKTRMTELKPAAVALIRILAKPATEIALGVTLLVLGLYLSVAASATSTLMALGGGAAVAVGALQLKRQRKPKVTVSRKRMMGLIAAGGVFLVGGTFAMFQAVPFFSLLVLLGAGCVGLGVLRLRMRRRNRQPRLSE